MQQLVAGLVSEGIVDVFEMVEVEKQHRQLPVVASCLVDALAQKLAEQVSIRQRCKAVVIGQVFDTLGMGDMFLDGALAA